MPKQSARLVAGQRRQLRALHAVSAGGGGRDAGAAARGDAAAGDPEADLSAARGDRRPRSRGEDGGAARPRRRDRGRCPTTSCCSRSARSRGCCRCPGLAEHAVGFKSLADAICLRNHVVETLEEANATEDPARREELLTYVFVGGGYAGLEALAELQDFAADAMDSYPRARLHGMRWVLVEATDRVLPEIDRELADYALRELRGRGIDIRLGDHAGGGRPPTAPGSPAARRCRRGPSSGPPASPRSRSSAS